MDTLRIPILKIGTTLITSIQTELHDASAVQFKDDLLERIHTTRAQGVWCSPASSRRSRSPWWS